MMRQPPEEWHKMVDDPNVLVFDCRNEYESEVGALVVVVVVVVVVIVVGDDGSRSHSDMSSASSFPSSSSSSSSSLLLLLPPSSRWVVSPQPKPSTPPSSVRHGSSSMRGSRMSLKIHPYSPIALVNRRRRRRRRRGFMRAWWWW